MRVSELQMKDIVSVIDGKRLGRIIDIEMNEFGQINYFIVEPKGIFKGLAKGEGAKIYMENIKKIGEDVILVEIK